MARIGSRDTGPEMQVRRLLHAAGFRYRLHVRNLPGRPDIVLPRWRAVVDVRGCYWHQHRCRLFQQPRDNAAFWSAKLTGNAERDSRNRLKLEQLGWRQLVVWECALRGAARLDPSELGTRIAEWLRADVGYAEIPAQPQDR